MRRVTPILTFVVHAAEVHNLIDMLMAVCTTDVLTIDALNSLRRLFFAKLFYPHVGSTEELVCSRLLANP